MEHLTCRSTLTVLSLTLVFMLNDARAISLPHTHLTKGKINLETEVHGAYSPRDQQHYMSDGDHRSEFDHEAVLGSRGTAEEYDHLPPEEAKKRLKILALKMDKNNDGQVDRKELIDWVLRSFNLLTQEEALERLEDDDANEDGKVTWSEHLQESFGSYDDDNNNVESPEEKRMIKEDEELFKAADLDRNGALDKKEYPFFSHPEEFPHMQGILYQQTMNKKDQNQDGTLSLEEFLLDGNGKSPEFNSEYYTIEKDRFHHDYDLNKDGKLDKEEILLWLIPNNREMAETEADHLIDSSDLNGDRKLSIEEIVEHHEVFVGSEATDFGEHLHNTHKFEDEL